MRILPHYPDYEPCDVRWLGRLPSHWEVRRLKMAAYDIATGATPSDQEFDEEGSIGWFSPADFTSALDLIAAGKKVKPDAFDRGIRRFPAHSVLLVGIGATLGKVGYIEENASGNQ